MDNRLLMTRTWVEIDRGALLQNHGRVREMLPPGCGIMAVVKADAYGHGAVEVAGLLSDRVECFGVASAYEAFELRKNGIENDILILGGTSKELFPELVACGIMPSVFDEGAAEALSAAAGDGAAPCFIAVDTGMSRIGFPDDTNGFESIRRIVSLGNIAIKGIFSHFARADEADKTSAQAQLTRFRRFTSRLDAAGISVGLKCLSNSAGIMELDAAFDMVREGIILYGIYPSDEVDRTKIPLRPVLSLKTRVELVKTVPPGTGVSYGHISVTERTTKIATLCAGYADGVPRLLSNCGSVLIRGKRAPIIGRVCMDQMMVDVTDIPGVSENDTATIIGRDGDAYISVDEVAAEAETIPYEVLCSLSRPRLPRVYIG